MDQAQEGLFSPFLRKRRIQAALPYLRGRVLDIGCGAGALAAYVDSRNYVGVDRDAEVVKLARAIWPSHTFSPELPAEGNSFDTIIGLAVIEHLDDPVEFLTILRTRLREGGESRIVLSTPHPSMEFVHAFGSKLGFFSAHANEEHQGLLDAQRMKEIAEQSALELETARYFLCGANQLFILKANR